MARYDIHSLELIGALDKNQQPAERLLCGRAVGAEAGPLTGGPDPTRRTGPRSGPSTGIRRAVWLDRRTPFSTVAVASGGASRFATPLALAVAAAECRTPLYASAMARLPINRHLWRSPAGSGVSA